MVGIKSCFLILLDQYKITTKNTPLSVHVKNQWLHGKHTQHAAINLQIVHFLLYLKLHLQCI